MNALETRTVMHGVVVLLESVRTKRLAVLENPYLIDEIIEALEHRATFLRAYCTKSTDSKGYVVRRKLYGTNGKTYQDLKIVDGLPVHKEGKLVVHPNGRPWTKEEVKIEQAQLAYRLPREVRP